MVNGVDGWQEKVRETHLSTLAARPQTAPWFSRAYGYQGWPQGYCAPEMQGPQALVSLGGIKPPHPGDGHRTSQDPV